MVSYRRVGIIKSLLFEDTISLVLIKRPIPLSLRHAPTTHPDIWTHKISRSTSVIISIHPAPNTKAPTLQPRSSIECKVCFQTDFPWDSSTTICNAVLRVFRWYPPTTGKIKRCGSSWVNNNTKKKYQVYIPTKYSILTAIICQNYSFSNKVKVNYRQKKNFNSRDTGLDGIKAK